MIWGHVWAVRKPGHGLAHASAKALCAEVALGLCVRKEQRALLSMSGLACPVLLLLSCRV
jgi:hypothetical protein